LRWNKPDHDGGNPVSGYIIEYKEKNSNEWVQCNSYPIKLPEYTCSNVVEEATYEFRVKAVNDAGPGAPSPSSKPQKAEPPTSKLAYILTSIIYQP
jgi:hypothetical protein